MQIYVLQQHTDSGCCFLQIRGQMNVMHSSCLLYYYLHANLLHTIKILFNIFNTSVLWSFVQNTIISKALKVPGDGHKWSFIKIICTNIVD